MIEILDELNELKALIEAQAISNKDVLTFEEACTYTGISKSFLYKMTSAKQLPFYKPGGKLVFFKRSELDDWLLQNRNVTVDELETKANNWLKKNGRTSK